jgi:hypothetical protein
MFLSLTSYALFGFLCFMFEFELTKVYLFIVCFHSFHAHDIMKFHFWVFFQTKHDDEHVSIEIK